MILDTNALSAWAEGRREVEGPLRAARCLVLPTIALGEYYFGVRQSRHRRRLEEWLAGNLPLVEVAAVTAGTAAKYADIRLELKRTGSPIPQNDAWIAALARQHSLAILSNDRHFDAVQGLKRIAF